MQHIPDNPIRRVIKSEQHRKLYTHTLECGHHYFAYTSMNSAPCWQCQETERAKQPDLFQCL